MEIDVCDTGSEAQYDRLRPLSYQKADAILVCYAVDNPRTLESAEQKVCAIPNCQPKRGY